MKTLVYVPVYIKGEDDLPKEIGIYICHLSNSGSSTEYHFFNLENNIQFWLSHFDFWLKPVELPDEEEIKSESEEQILIGSYGSREDEIYYEGFRHGANWFKSQILK